MSNVTIRDIRTIFTEPDGIRLVIVKIETSEPGLYGIGCATFTQRPTAVKSALDDYLRPLLLGRDVADIEDVWQTSYISSYWRNGPVLNNAMSGVDQALWDIKGKMAGMPVHDLFGGKALGRRPHRLGPRYHQRFHVRRHALSLRDTRRFTQIRQPGVRAGADERDVDLRPLDRRAAGQPIDLLRGDFLGCCNTAPQRRTTAPGLDFKHYQ